MRLVWFLVRQQSYVVRWRKSLSIVLLKVWLLPHGDRTKGQFDLLRRGGGEVIQL